MGVGFVHSRGFVSDGAPHFKNETLKLVAVKLGASHRFSVAHYSTWSNGTMEGMDLEVVRTFRAVMGERGHPLAEWPDTFYAVKLALNSTYRKWMGDTPLELMTRRVPRTAFSIIADELFNDWGGGDTTTSSPGRSPKHPLPEIGLQDPLHGGQACPESNSVHQGVGQICPR